MLGVFLDLASLDREDLDLTSLKAILPEWQFYQQTSPDDVQEHISHATVVISNKVTIGAEQMAQAPSLKLICVAATGTNNVDLQAARKLGITVCNIQRYATPSVAQHVFALMLSLSIHLPEYHQAVREGRWQQSDQFCLFDFPVREIAGKTLGIIGYGELGKAVTSIAQAFGMRVLIAQRDEHDDRENRLPLNELLRQVDVLSLHCPLTPETKGLIGPEQLALMKPDAILINTARGGIVDEQALAEALCSGRLGGAGVDVISEEPPLHGNPLLDQAIPNLIITPHIAWSSREARQRLTDELVLNIEAFLNGKPRNLVV
jgi:glycerate dehydrogenase